MSSRSTLYLYEEDGYSYHLYTEVLSSEKNSHLEIEYNNGRYVNMVLPQEVAEHMASLFSKLEEDI